MMGQSSWALNRRRYDSYGLRGAGNRRNGHYPPQPSYIRVPRRGGAINVPGPIRNILVNSYRGQKISSTDNNLKKCNGSTNELKTSYKSPPQLSNSGCKNSSSMVDLSPGASIKPEVLDLRSESTTSLRTRLRRVQIESKSCEVARIDALSAREVQGGIWPEVLDRNFEESKRYLDTGKAASLVCRVLVVNAWRRRKEENLELHETIGKLGEQVDHLHIQIVVLRRLLDAENGRVGKFMSEIQRVKVQFEDIIRERDALKLEKENAVQDAKQQRDKTELNNVTTENLRNELFTSNNQLNALDGQINKDREKLLKLREDKKILLDKVATSEALASERLLKAETASAEAEDLKGQLNAHIALLATAHEQQQKSSKEVKLKTEETMRMKKKLQGCNEDAKMLSLREKNVENELSNRDAALRRLESAYNSQLSELTELRERLTQQSEERGWSTRVLQIAGSVVRAPRVILRTLSYLSNPISSVTS